MSSDDSDLVGSSRAPPRGGGADADAEADAAKDDGAIRSALHFAVGRICEQEEDDDLDAARMSSTAVESLAELVYQYATTSLANDLVAFSRHAGRKTVTVDDVKLAIRKDKKTHDSLGRFCEKKGLASSTSSAAARGRKKKASSATAASGAKRSKKASSAGNAGTSTKRKSKNEERRQKMRDAINAASSSDSDSMESSGDDKDSSDDDDSCLQPVHVMTPKKTAAANEGIGEKSNANAENDTTDGGEADDMVVDLASD